MNWKIEYTETAKKALLSIDREAAKRIKRYLDTRIASNENPRRFGEALAENLAGLWKYRIGNFRVIAEIQDDNIVVLIVRIGHRSKVYGGH